MKIPHRGTGAEKFWSVGMKHCFLINPDAGKGKKVNTLCREIERVCQAGNAEYEIFISPSAGELAAHIPQTVEKYAGETVRFYACGGDGTLSEAANGIMRLVDRSTVSLGVIPIGTGNDFVRNFTGQEKFLDVGAQLNGCVRRLDLLRCNDDYAVNMVNIGFDCEVVSKTATLKAKPWVPSGFAYLLGLMITLIRKPGVDMTLSCDGGEEERHRFLLTTFANGGFCGGGFHSNPYTSPEDGHLDDLYINDVTRRTFLSLVKSYKKGTHIRPENEKVLYNRKEDFVKMTFDRETNVSLDGEIRCVRELSLSVEKQVLPFWMPAGVGVLWQEEPAVEKKPEPLEIGVRNREGSL